jgi:hypothetical protein
MLQGCLTTVEFSASSQFCRNYILMSSHVVLHALFGPEFVVTIQVIYQHILYIELLI